MCIRIANTKTDKLIISDAGMDAQYLDLSYVASEMRNLQGKWEANM
jgi:hypothetical protein